MKLELDECDIIHTVLVLFDQAFYVVKNSLKVAGYSLHGEATFAQEVTYDCVVISQILVCEVFISREF